MNGTTKMSEEEIRNALDSIARTYQPPRPARFVKLIPYKNQIHELRGQNASFETIARFLRKFSVRVSDETVRRFHRIVIEQKPLRRKRKKANVKTHSVKSKNAKPSKTRDIGEPRIARIEDL